MTLSPFHRLIVPLILLLVGISLKLFVEPPDEVQPLLDWLTYIVLGIALALSAYNDRARLFTATAALLILYHIIATRLQVSLENQDALRLYILICVLLPLQLLYLVLVTERGLWNRYGAGVFASLPVLMLSGIGLFYLLPDEASLGFIDHYLAVRPVTGYVMPVYTSIGMTSVLALAVVRLYRRNSEHDSALVMVLLLSFIMLALFDRAGISDLMLALAGLCLLVAMVRGSHELAYRDELTGLPGRRSLNERLKSLGRNYVIAMMDVDHFKKFNDTYGHDTGDDVLKMVAMHIGAVEGGATAYRYGGEEFCVVFPGKPDADVCGPFLEAVRIAIEKYKLVLREKESRTVSPEIARQRRGRRAGGRGEKNVSVTISIGVAASGDVGATPEDVIKVADKALYQAKKKGRNRLVVHA